MFSGPPSLLPAAVKGILEAQQFNTCGRRSNGTNECIEDVDILTSENDTNPSEEREGGIGDEVKGKGGGGATVADTGAQFSCDGILLPSSDGGG